MPRHKAATATDTATPQRFLPFFRVLRPFCLPEKVMTLSSQIRATPLSLAAPDAAGMWGTTGWMWGTTGWMWGTTG